MLFYVLLVVAAAVVGRLAEIEDRNPFLWGVCAAGCGWVLAEVMGMWALAAPALVVVGGFFALWIAKLRDEGGGRGGRIID